MESHSIYTAEEEKSLDQSASSKEAFTEELEEFPKEVNNETSNEEHSQQEVEVDKERLQLEQQSQGDDEGSESLDDDSFLEELDEYSLELSDKVFSVVSRIAKRKIKEAKMLEETKTRHQTIKGSLEAVEKERDALKEENARLREKLKTFQSSKD